MAQRCRVKICGITSVQDAQMVSTAGVDAVGLVFYPKSPRHVEIDQAVTICQALPPFVSKVGLFLNAEASYVQQVLTQVPLDVLQFHGNESLDYCQSFQHTYIKAVGMQGEHNLLRFVDAYPDSQGFLIDSHAPGAAGGTGKVFDWTQVPHAYPKPLILAGGLKPDNVANAIQITQVHAVDVSSGVESSPGVKDPDKVSAFMQEVKRIEQ